MFAHYLVTALRHMRRDPLTYAVSLLGLVAGFVIFSLAFLFTNYERNHDQFVPDAERIVTVNLRIVDGTPFGTDIFTTIFTELGPEAKEKFPEVELAARRGVDDIAVEIEGETWSPTVNFVDQAFFSLFPFDWIAGGPGQMATRVEAAVISESEAKRIFGIKNAADALGRTIPVEDKIVLEIVGVFRDFPVNSHLTHRQTTSLEFGLVAGFRAYEKINDITSEGDWGLFNGRDQVYLKLVPGTDFARLESELWALTNERTGHQWQIWFEGTFLLPVSDMNLFYWQGGNGPPWLDIFELAGTLILLLAIINSISLNMAKLMARRREIAMRRALGANRSQIITQFLGESVGFAVLALVLALLLLTALVPELADYTGKPYALASMIDGGTGLFLVTSAVLTGLLSAAYPAWMVTVRQGGINQQTTPSTGVTRLRSSLAALQFALIASLILGIFVMERQNTHMFSRIRSFDAPGILTLMVNNEKEEIDKVPVLAEELRRMPAVRAVTVSNKIPSGPSGAIARFKSDIPEQAFNVNMIGADPYFLEFYGLEPLFGRSLEERDLIERRDDDEEEPEEGITYNALVNQDLLRALDLPMGAEALGEVFPYGPSTGPNFIRVVGILPPLHMEKVDLEEGPLVMFYDAQFSYALSIRLDGPDPNLFKEIEELAKSILPEGPIKVQWLADMISTYTSFFRQLMVGYSAFTGLALLIAVSGLYALAATLAASRQREAAIRKVLGATTTQIIRHLTWKFSLPVLAALVIGLPVGYWLVGFYLDDFPDRIILTPVYALVAGLVTLALGWLAVGFHAFRCARQLPARVLAYE